MNYTNTFQIQLLSLDLFNYFNSTIQFYNYDLNNAIHKFLGFIVKVITKITITVHYKKSLQRDIFDNLKKVWVSHEKNTFLNSNSLYIL